jgi:DNA repair exonuclease SbcCD ATPase subunit
MAYARVASILAIAAAVSVGACNRSEQVDEAATRPGAEADPNLNERNDDAVELEKRVAEIERKWNEMQVEVKEENRAPTAALREEVKEDVANAREAVANLKTTSPDNWWERHEKATERTLDDIEQDVQRFAKGRTAAPAVAAEPVGTTASFDERRGAWIANARARVDAMEERLKDVKTDGALETELEDTRARIDKLQDDLDRLRTASPDEWWDVSEARVREYIDRVDRSIGRLDNDRAGEG